MATALFRSFNPIPTVIRRWHQRALSKRLMQMGLCYHDIIQENEVLLKALTRLPPEMQEARVRRIRRAVDMSMKKMYLSEDQWEDPWREYDTVAAVLGETQREVDERKHLSEEPWLTHFGAQPWYEYDTENAWFWRSALPAPKAEPKKLA